MKVAHPDRAVMAICGDGGFMFTMPELATAVQHGINLVTVVFNDGGFGNVRRTQKLGFDGHYIASDLRNPDFMQLAKSFGVLGMRAESPQQLQQLLPEAFAARARSRLTDGVRDARRSLPCGRYTGGELFPVD